MMAPRDSPQSIKETLAILPDRPGVYLMRDSQGRPLYIGKALSLHKRVPSYFHDPASLPPRLVSMVSRVRRIEFIVTETEIEAFILESNLVKEQRPKYNIVLRDDKHYPFLRIDLQEPFPRPTVARRIRGDGALYFGPYVPASAMWDTLALINKIFPLRKCKTLRSSPKPCLEFHMGRCLAPCGGRVSETEYGEILAQVRALLEGKRKDLLRQLKALMKEASSHLDYERAARLRDQICSLEKALQEQRVISSGRENLDVFGLAFQGGAACVQAFTFREGRLLGRESFLYRGVGEGEREALLSSFLQQFYSSRLSLPQGILLPFAIPEEALLGDWLKKKKGQVVTVTVPSRGKKQRLLQLALANAQQALEGLSPVATLQEEGARELHEVLTLPKGFRTIEAYDISNISGSQAVGSMVVWDEGIWRKDHYRRFRIKSVVGPNDLAMMEEVLRRRLAHRQELPLPDLFLLDGGRGQLQAGLKALREEGLSELPIIALAKAEEEIWLPGKRKPLRLPPDSPALHLLQRIRDEAHRFALSYHRLLRGKRGLHSLLDEIPGIGSKRKRALLEYFGNLKTLKGASLEELRTVPGISASLAAVILKSLRSFLPQVHPKESKGKKD
jgi:excinuclease ABC subunit C